MSRRAKPSVSDEPREIQLRPVAVLVGVVVSYLVSVALGYLLQVSGAASGFFLQPLALVGALMAGGYATGRVARTSGFINGVGVAVIYIVIWAVQNALFEARLVQLNGPLALPPMNMGGIVLGDLLYLSAGAFGGWLGDPTRAVTDAGTGTGRAPRASHVSQSTPDRADSAT